MALLLQVLHLVLALGNLVLEVFTVVAIEEEHKEANYCQAGNSQEAAYCETVKSGGNGLNPQNIYYDYQLRNRINLLHDQTGPCCESLH
jgi:hypothetical protein